MAASELSARFRPGERVRVRKVYPLGHIRTPFYRVRFLQTQVWPGYRGHPEDAVEVEIFQHWLEPGRA